MAVPSEKAQSLNRVVRILESFSQERPELGVREVARLVELPSSVTGRLMLAMKDLGVLSQNPMTRAYSIGPRVLTWAGTYLSTCDIRIVAYPYLDELHQATHETISLYILDGGDRVCIERLESTQNIRFVAPRVGRRLPLHAGSAGKVMLAYLSEAAREELLVKGPLEALTERTIVDPTQLRVELEKIRRQGYAVSFGEWILDASGVAAPIFDRNGEVLAALTISGPTQRFQGDVLPEYIEKVKRVARVISAGMGYRGREGD
ncbi:MAG: IclR family transcriptional regulator [Anaerolineaceae bacterium]|nr:IclR family transcriptional regulator [Anaerolineaceae bacterium]